MERFISIHHDNERRRQQTELPLKTEIMTGEITRGSTLNNVVQ